MTLSPAQPVADITLESLEETFSLPSHTSTRRSRVVHPLRRNPDAASVPDAVRAPLDAAEQLALALLVSVVVGGLTLIVIALVG